MAKTFVITLTDYLEQALAIQAENQNKSPEEIRLQLLSEKLIDSSRLEDTQKSETDPLLQLMGSLSVDIPDLAENHDYYIGQALYQELKGVE